MFHFLWMYFQEELLDHVVVLFSTFLKVPHTVFHSGCTSLQSHQECTKVPFSPYPCQHFSLSFLVMTVIKVRGDNSWFYFAFLSWLVMLSIFSCSLWPFICLLWKKCLYLNVLCPFLNWIITCHWVVWVLYVSNINPLSDVWFEKTFSPFSWLSFHFASDFCFAEAL